LPEFMALKRKLLTQNINKRHECDTPYSFLIKKKSSFPISRTLIPVKVPEKILVECFLRFPVGTTVHPRHRAARRGCCIQTLSCATLLVLVPPPTIMTVHNCLQSWNCLSNTCRVLLRLLGTVTSVFLFLRQRKPKATH